jgi:hypothetical protein
MEKRMSKATRMFASLDWRVLPGEQDNFDIRVASSRPYCEVLAERSLYEVPEAGINP